MAPLTAGASSPPRFMTSQPTTNAAKPRAMSAPSRTYVVGSAGIVVALVFTGFRFSVSIFRLLSAISLSAAGIPDLRDQPV